MFANTRSSDSPTTVSILSQALPGQLAAPRGWRSEMVDSTSSLIPTDIGTSSIHTSSYEKHGEYQTLNTSDAPPIIYSSTTEVNRMIPRISPTTVRSRTISEYSNTILGDGLSQKQKGFYTKDQNNLITTSDDQQPPLVLHKTLPNNTVTYQQNVSVRYLQPPTPPPPGPIIIREIRAPPPAPPSPVQIRQRPPPPCTPPPIIIREQPPPAPPRLPSEVVEKHLPPPPCPPRRMIVERFASCPAKPPDVVIERWLPYKRTDRRQILFERALPSYIPVQDPDTLILHGTPNARIHKEFINQGVTRADPLTYLQRYGSEIDSWHNDSKYSYLIGEATRTLPPPHSLGSTGDYHHDYYGSHSSRYPPSPVPQLANVWDRMRSASPPPYSMANVWDRMRAVSPPPYSMSNVWDRMRSGSPLPYPMANVWDRMRSASPLPYPSSYCNDSSYRHSTSYPRHSTSYPRHYDDYPSYRGDMRTMVDITPSWSRNCQSRLPSYDFSPPHHPRMVQVNSDGELDHVLSDLTRGRGSSSSSRFY